MKHNMKLGEMSRDLLLIAFLGLLSFVPLAGSFSSEELILVHDYSFPLHITADPLLSYGWDHRALTGVNDMLLSPCRIPYQYALYLLNSIIGIPDWLINRMQIVLSFFIQGVGTYVLLRAYHRSRVASLAGGVFSMLNPVVALRMAYGQPRLLLQNGFIPIVLASYAWSRKRGHSPLKVAAIVSLVTLPITIMGLPVEIGFVFFSFVLMIIIETLFSPVSFSTNARILFFCGVISILINSWWAIPGLYFMAYSRGQFYTVKEEYSMEVLNRTSSFSSILNSLRLYSLDIGQKFPFYDQMWLKIAGLAILPIAFCFILTRKDVLTSYALVTLVVAIALFQGTNPPLGRIYDFLYHTVPGFFVYRDANHFDSLLYIAVGILVGSSVDSFHSHLKKGGHMRLGIRVLTIPAIVVSGAVLVTYMVPLLGGNLNGFLSPVKVPDYYYEALRYLQKENLTSRIFYPHMGSVTAYEWALNANQRYTMQNVFFIDPFLPPVVSDVFATYSPTLPTRARELIEDMSDGLDRGIIGVSKSLGLLSIRYVVIDTKDHIGIAPLIERTEGIELDKQIGSIKIYRVNECQPYFYVADSVFPAHRNEKLSDILPHLESKHPVILYDGDWDFDTSKVNLSPKIRLNSTYLDDANYKLRIECDSSFLLVFTETYDAGWTAQSGTKVYDHFIANGYANGWVIEASGVFEVSVEFKPSVTLGYGGIISLMSLASIGIYLLHGALAGRRGIHNGTKRE